MRGKRSILALFACLIVLASPAAVLADTRVALLIGNGTYAATARLANPANDVALMKTVLEQAGFDSVDTSLDLDRAGMIKALRAFETKAGAADIAVIYYSGHGMEMGGRNYALPVDARLATDGDVEDEAVALDRIERSLRGAKRLRLIILDACRNNPFEATMAHGGATRAVARGLSRVEPETGDTLIAFAAKAGTLASDGDGANSPFASALAKHLATPGVDVRIAFGLVRDEVLSLTGRQQEPFVYGSLGGAPLALSKTSPSAPPPAAPLPAPGPATCADAAAHWAAAQRFDKLEFYQNHVALFGTCAFAPFARARIEELSRVATAPPPQAPEVPAVRPADPAPTLQPEIKPPIAPPQGGAEGAYALPAGANVIVQLGHADTVNAVSISPDDRWLLSASDDRTVKLWDRESGKLLRTFQGHTGAVQAVAFSPTAAIFASGDSEGILTVWDLDGHAIRSTSDGPTVKAVAFSADGRLLASGSGNTIRIRDATSGDILRTIEGHSDYVRSLAFTTDGRLLASGSDDRTAKLWNVSTGELVHTFGGHEDYVMAIAISPDGRTLASGSKETIRLWDIGKPEIPRAFGTNGNVYSLAFSPDGRWLASGASDNDVRLWEAASARLDRVLEGHSGNVYALAFSHDGRRLVSGSGDEAVKVWDIAAGGPVQTLEGPATGVRVAAFSRDGRAILSGGTGRVLRLLDAASGKPALTFEGADRYLLSAAFSPDGRLLATGGSDYDVKIWDTASGALVRKLEGHTDWVRSIAFSADGRFIASGGDDQLVKLWTLEGELLHTLEGHTDDVSGVAFLPGGKRLLSAGGKELKLWDVAGGKLVRTFAEAETNIYALALSPDGRTAAAGGIYGKLGLWSIDSGKRIRGFETNDGAEPDHHLVRAVAFSPDGRQLLSGGDAYALRLWNAGDGTLIRRFEGHRGNVHAVGFAADARSIVSGSADRTLRVWDADGGRMVAAFMNGPDAWASIAPDGSFVASDEAEGFFAIVRGNELLPTDEFIRRKRQDHLDVRIAAGR